MFTGIVVSCGRVVEFVKLDSGAIAKIKLSSHHVENLVIGSSIACSGVCLTVEKIEGCFVNLHISQETLSKTNLSSWLVDTKFNLEFPLKYGDPLGGHIVQGHVDCITKIVDIQNAGLDHILEFKTPQQGKNLILEKGSIAIDGISLTVNRFRRNCFFVNIIPHTWSETTLRDRKIGDMVNVEFDLILKNAMNKYSDCSIS